MTSPFDQGEGTLPARSAKWTHGESICRDAGSEVARCSVSCLLALSIRIPQEIHKDSQKARRSGRLLRCVLDRYTLETDGILRPPRVHSREARHPRWTAVIPRPGRLV